MKSSESIPEKTNLCNEELRRHLADYSIPELLEIMDQTIHEAVCRGTRKRRKNL